MRLRIEKNHRPKDAGNMGWIEGDVLDNVEPSFGAKLVSAGNAVEIDDAGKVIGKAPAKKKAARKSAAKKPAAKKKASRARK